MPRALLEPLLFVSVIQSRVDLTAGGGAATYAAIAGIMFLTALTASAYGEVQRSQRSPPAVAGSLCEPAQPAR